jgi:hypothetical protein
MHAVAAVAAGSVVVERHLLCPVHLVYLSCWCRPCFLDSHSRQTCHHCPSPIATAGQSCILVIAADRRALRSGVLGYRMTVAGWDWRPSHQSEA